jgi:hypothetical protein
MRGRVLSAFLAPDAAGTGADAAEKRQQVCMVIRTQEYGDQQAGSASLLLSGRGEERKSALHSLLFSLPML